MKDELISFQTAVLAKEKGFNIPVNSYSNVVEPDRVIEVGAFNHNHKQPTTVSRPTQSLLQRWLRETYKIYAEVMVYRDGRFKFSVMRQSEDNYFTIFKMYNTYEEALEAAFPFALNKIKI